jgi:hypothetical protein
MKWHWLENEVNSLHWGERVKNAGTMRKQRGGPTSQRSHPKPSPTLQLYEDWRTPAIVPILQYHFAVVEQARAESPHSFRVLRTLLG